MSKYSYSELRLISYALYKEYYYDCLSNWNVVSIRYDSKTGLYAETFLKDDTYVIAFRGTDCNSGIIELGLDLANDFQLALAELSAQYKPAEKYTKEMCKLANGKDVIITGYSLGASIGQMVASQLGLKAVLFEPFGTGNIINPKYVDNIINYGNEKDPIFIKNINNQIGETRIITNNKEKLANEKIYFSKGFNINYDLKTHMPENNGDLSTYVIYSGKTRFCHKYKKDEKSNQYILKGYISKNYYNQNGHWVTIDGNHVFIED